jgi:hypothetical protein
MGCNLKALGAAFGLSVLGACTTVPQEALIEKCPPRYTNENAPFSPSIVPSDTAAQIAAEGCEIKNVP